MSGRRISLRRIGLLLGALLLGGNVRAGAPANAEVPEIQTTEKAAADSEGARLDEMYRKMKRAVEEVAELYGSPRFVQVFTNDRPLADELRLRLRATDSLKQLNAEVEELSRRLERIKAELAKNEAEASAANQRLVKQRAALSAVANAVDQASRAVEGSVP